MVIEICIRGPGTRPCSTAVFMPEVGAGGVPDGRDAGGQRDPHVLDGLVEVERERRLLPAQRADVRHGQVDVAVEQAGERRSCPVQSTASSPSRPDPDGHDATVLDDHVARRGACVPSRRTSCPPRNTVLAVAAAHGRHRFGAVVRAGIHRGAGSGRHHGGMVSAISYGTGVPDEGDLRLCGDVSGKRVIELGGTANAIAFAERGARAMAAAEPIEQVEEGREQTEQAGVRVEFHAGDMADLGFATSGSVDLVFSTALAGVDDLARVLRQAHRVLRPEARWCSRCPTRWRPCSRAARSCCAAATARAPAPRATTSWP